MKTYNHHAFLISDKISGQKYLILYTTKNNFLNGGLKLDSIYSVANKHIRLFKKNCDTQLLQQFPTDTSTDELHDKMIALSEKNNAFYIKRSNHHLPKRDENNICIRGQRNSIYSLYEIDFNEPKVIFIDRGNLTYLRQYFDNDSIYSRASKLNTVYLNKYIFKKH